MMYGFNDGAFSRADTMAALTYSRCLSACASTAGLRHMNHAMRGRTGEHSGAGSLMSAVAGASCFSVKNWHASQRETD